MADVPSANASAARRQVAVLNCMSEGGGNRKSQQVSGVPSERISKAPRSTHGLYANLVEVKAAVLRRWP